MKTRIASQDLGMPDEFWGKYTKKNTVWVRVIKDGAVIDAFNCERSKVQETVEAKYGKDATYKI